MSTYAEALAALQSDETPAPDDVRRWIDSGDLLTWSVVYALLERGSEIGDAEIDFVRRYLLRCIEENPTPGDYLHAGYEAAWELAAMLKRWRERGSTDAIHGIAVDLEKLYRRGDDAIRNRVLCGVLEHAFEDPNMRAHFANWDRDPELREGYRLAIEWGTAHQD